MQIREFKYFFPESIRLLHISQPLFKRLSDDKDWVAEKKYNGTRLQLHCINGGYEFYNRHAEKIQYKPTPEILDVLKSFNMQGYCLFDGELRHNKVVGIRDKIMIYDVFIWNNELMIGRPFWYRRNFLKSILTCGAEPVGCPEQYSFEFDSVFKEVTEDPEIEGLVMKNMQGVLQLGRSSACESKWMFKCRRANGSYRF